MRTIDPDPAVFKTEHDIYVNALEAAGLDVIRLPPLEDFPDSVFVEDTAICVDGVAILLRPGAPSRRGESTAIQPALEDVFSEVVSLPGQGFVDGGDVLLTDDHAFIGLSKRTNEAGIKALATLLSDHGYGVRRVETPGHILHFKTDCGLIDAETIFATKALAEMACFDGYNLLLAPDGEEAAANLIRVNETVMLSAGFPKTEAMLRTAGYQVRVIPTTQAALVDGGLSCMSLRF